MIGDVLWKGCGYKTNWNDSGVENISELIIGKVQAKEV